MSYGSAPYSSHAPVDEIDLRAAERLTDAYRRMTERLGQVIVGQSGVVKQVLIALFCQGHCIVEGVPGLAKTLMISTLAQLLSLQFKRIRFTPDLMPSDITGAEVLEEVEGSGKRAMKFIKGPIFGNIILGDEINRTPPKTQAALLQAMQEGRVTVGGVDFILDRPFLVLGTQNPIEQEGTYPLPEAQLDRFLFKVLIDYPNYQEELRIALSTTSGDPPALQPVLDRDAILEFQRLVRKVLISESLAAYAVKIVRATRPNGGEAPDFVKKYLTWGAGPRACQAILLAAKANALIDGRVHVSSADVQSVVHPVLRHRIAMNYRAESDGMKPDALISQLLDAVRP